MMRHVRSRNVPATNSLPYVVAVSNVQQACRVHERGNSRGRDAVAAPAVVEGRSGLWSSGEQDRDRGDRGVGGQRRRDKRNRSGAGGRTSGRPAGWRGAGERVVLRGCGGAFRALAQVVRGGRRAASQPGDGLRRNALWIVIGRSLWLPIGIRWSFSGWPSSGRSALRTSWRVLASAGRWATAGCGRSWTTACCRRSLHRRLQRRAHVVRSSVGRNHRRSCAYGRNGPVGVQRSTGSRRRPRRYGRSIWRRTGCIGATAHVTP
jgi:hypothetical protein